MIDFFLNPAHFFVCVQAIRVLGLLGALDPYKHKLNQTGGLLVGGNSAKDSTDNEAGQI